MSSHAGRIVVFLKHQSPTVDPVQHSCSKALALLLISARLARLLSPADIKEGIHLTTPEPWREVKNKFRLLPRMSKVIPRIKPPRRPESLILTYPPRHYESDGARKQAELWLNATRF